jgi:hypothetical protein
MQLEGSGIAFDFLPANPSQDDTILNWPFNSSLEDPSSQMPSDSQGGAFLSTPVFETPVTNTPLLIPQTINPTIIDMANDSFPSFPTWIDDRIHLPDGIHNPSQYAVGLLDGLASTFLPSVAAGHQCNRASEERLPAVDSNDLPSLKHSPSDEATDQAPSKRRR